MKAAASMVIGAALAIGLAAIAVAHGTPYVSTCVRSTVAHESDCSGFPGLVVEFGGQVAPKRLPGHEMAPVAVRLWGKVATSDGTHPSALREATIELDRSVAVDAKGLPACHPFVRHRVVGDLSKTCRGAIVGGGRADFEIASPEQAPIRTSSKMTVYNGGGGNLYVVGVATTPPRTVVIPVEIGQIPGVRHGLRAVAKIPRIAGGSGSLIDFSLGVKRRFTAMGKRESYVTARCPGDHIETVSSLSFKNEARVPGVPTATLARGRTAFPCSTK